MNRLLPADLGKYSMSEASRCKYMRRHLARWMRVFAYPQVRSTSADWNLMLHGMGKGPTKGASALGINTFARAAVFTRAFSKVLFVLKKYVAFVFVSHHF